MQKLAASRSEINVVDDQIGVPNWTRWLARTTAAILDQGLARLVERGGLYHLCALGRASWFDFAREILRDRANVRVSPIATSQYPTPARRPAYGVLDATRFARTFGIVPPDWQTLLHECLQSEAEPPDARPVH
jgi:dTDP-4-dehydrorhamnose reductase